MPLYEFTCAKGHVVEDLVPMGTQTIPCHVCQKLAEAGKQAPEVVLATRILSPTRTTFEFADNRKYKGWKK